MQPYGVNQLRKMFLEFFESKGHIMIRAFCSSTQGWHP